MRPRTPEPPADEGMVRIVPMDHGGPVDVPASLASFDVDVWREDGDPDGDDGYSVAWSRWVLAREAWGTANGRDLLGIRERLWMAGRLTPPPWKDLR
jgi:hypothetical protein